MYCHIRSMSFQSVTIPCSIGYRMDNSPLCSCQFTNTQLQVIFGYIYKYTMICHTWLYIQIYNCMCRYYPPRDPRLGSQSLVLWWGYLKLKWIWAHKYVKRAESNFIFMLSQYHELAMSLNLFMALEWVDICS